LDTRTNELYVVNHLSFSYPQQHERVLDELSFTVKPGQFITLCGPSGCGKSTLLRHLKTVLSPHGVRSGQISFEGTQLEALGQREQSSKIGFVLQSPDNQIVTDKVWHELAFGLESLGYDTPTIRGRVAEMASFFGIQTWFYKSVSELSGGQKQLLNLASIMAMQPCVLILDEPTSQLDPIAASDFLATLGKINRELGTTIIMTEHRLEQVFPMSDRVLVMDHGRILLDGSPRDVGKTLRDQGHSMFLAMPTPMRIFAAVPSDLSCPITVRDGRNWLDQLATTRTPSDNFITHKEDYTADEVVLSLKDVWFKYEKDVPDVVKGLSLSAHRGEFLAILGGNGTGKSTALSLMAGLNKPYRGAVLASGSVGVLPQNPQTLFVKKTVEEDLMELCKGTRLSQDEKAAQIAQVTRLCRLEALLARHPYDLSGGEQQRAALAKVLLLCPSILLLDEPTKGLDAEFKQVFAEILYSLLRQGVTIIMVSHDLEFCAEYAGRCALFFDGNIVTCGNPRSFFSGNSFYTTAANRMARHLLPEAATAADVIRACGGTPPPKMPLPTKADTIPSENKRPTVATPPGKLPWWRKILAVLSTAALVLTFLHATGLLPLRSLLGTDNGVYIVLIGALFLLALAISRREVVPIENAPLGKAQRKLPRRTTVSAIIILLLIPLIIFIGYFYLEERKYYFIALLVMLACMLPFFLVFEGRAPQARELIIIAVLCALGVAGRVAFYMLPQFKPIMAIVIISGVAFGGETGFLVGAVTMLSSNVLIGQGAWTPWQMFAMGIIGFLAGVLFHKGLLSRTRSSLCMFGAVVAIVIYGGIMNPASALMWQSTINLKILLAYCITGLPMDLIQAAATAFFLWFLSRPMLEKLDRVKVKYGLIEH